MPSARVLPFVPRDSEKKRERERGRGASPFLRPVERPLTPREVLHRRRMLDNLETYRMSMLWRTRPNVSR